MNEQRAHPRTTPPLEEQLLTIHGHRKNLFGRILDQSQRGLGIFVAAEARFEVGESLLVHRLQPHHLGLAFVRHVTAQRPVGVVLGIEWGQ